MRFAQLQQTELHVNGFSWMWAIEYSSVMWAFVPHRMHPPKYRRLPDL